MWVSLGALENIKNKVGQRVVWGKRAFGLREKIVYELRAQLREGAGITECISVRHFDDVREMYLLITLRELGLLQPRPHFPSLHLAPPMYFVLPAASP